MIDDNLIFFVMFHFCTSDFCDIMNVTFHGEIIVTIIIILYYQFILSLKELLVFQQLSMLCSYISQTKTGN